MSARCTLVVQGDLAAGIASHDIGVVTEYVVNDSSVGECDN